jgi:hypothetical protein
MIGVASDAVIKGVVVDISIRQNKDNPRNIKATTDSLKKVETSAVEGAKSTAAQRAKIETQSLIEREQRAKKSADSEIKEAERAFNEKLRLGSKWSSEIDKLAKDRDKSESNAFKEKLQLGAKWSAAIDKQIQDRAKKEAGAIKDIERSGQQMAAERERTAEQFHRAELRRHGEREVRAQGSGSMMFGGLAGFARGGLEFAAGHELSVGGIDAKEFAGKVAKIEGAYHMLAGNNFLQGLIGTRFVQGVEAVGMGSANRMGRSVMHVAEGISGKLGLSGVGAAGASSAAQASSTLGALALAIAGVGSAAAVATSMWKKGGAVEKYGFGGGADDDSLVGMIAQAEVRTATAAANPGKRSDWKDAAGNRKKNGGNGWDWFGLQHGAYLDQRTADMQKERDKIIEKEKAVEAQHDAGLEYTYRSKELDSGTRRRSAFRANRGDLAGGLAAARDEAIVTGIGHLNFAAGDKGTEKDRDLSFSAGVSQINQAMVDERSRSQARRSETNARLDDARGRTNARAQTALGGLQSSGGIEERSRAQALIQMWDGNKNVDAMRPEDLALVEQYGGAKRKREIGKAKEKANAAAFPEMAKDLANARREQGQQVDPNSAAGRFMGALGVPTGEKAAGTYAATFAVVVKSEVDEEKIIKRLTDLLKEAFKKKEEEEKKRNQNKPPSGPAAQAGAV